MKLLTGELTPQKGTVVRPAEARRPQPGSVRVRRVPRDRHGHHGQRAAVEALQERETLYAKADMTDADGMRLGELEGIVGEEDGYSAESDAAILLQGLDIPDELHERHDGGAAGRTEGPRAAGAGALRPSAGAAARRADEPPRPRLDPLAARVPRSLRRHADRHLARPPLPERRLHAHRRHRLRDHHHLHRRLRRHGARQDADPVAHRSRERAAREEDRAAQRLHRALLRRHAREPGAVTPQGSRAAADDGPRAVEHPAPLHQVQP